MWFEKHQKTNWQLMSTTKVQVSSLFGLRVVVCRLAGSASAAVRAQCAGVAAFLLLGWSQPLAGMPKSSSARVAQPWRWDAPALHHGGLPARHPCRSYVCQSEHRRRAGKAIAVQGSKGVTAKEGPAGRAKGSTRAAGKAASRGTGQAHHTAGSAGFHTAVVAGLQVLPAALVPAAFVASYAFALAMWPFAAAAAAAAAQPLLLPLLCHFVRGGFSAGLAGVGARRLQPGHAAVGVGPVSGYAGAWASELFRAPAVSCHSRCHLLCRLWRAHRW